MSKIERGGGIEGGVEEAELFEVPLRPDYSKSPQGRIILSPLKAGLFEVPSRSDYSKSPQGRIILSPIILNI